jgi:hypothetical protein
MLTTSINHNNSRLWTRLSGIRQAHSTAGWLIAFGSILAMHESLRLYSSVHANKPTTLPVILLLPGSNFPVLEEAWKSCIPHPTIDVRLQGWRVA